MDSNCFVKVLADEARLIMLWLLFNHRELCVCDIMAALEITQSKASRHLAALKRLRRSLDSAIKYSLVAISIKSRLILEPEIEIIPYR